MNDLTQARKIIKECQEVQNPYLDLGNCGISNLEGLPELFKCKHLKVLIFSERWWDAKSRCHVSCNKGEENKFFSIPEEISNLTNLTKLIVRNVRISEIGSLQKLSKLQYLDLDDNQVSDIRFLQGLTGLQYLKFSDNQVSDISPLQKLTGLKHLSFVNNQISDISSLQELTELQFLNIWYNQICSISSLQKLTKLHYLCLCDNQISDISPLQKLTKLHYLNLKNNQISDISFLKELTGLQRLDLSNNKITDISFLQKLTGLKYLGLKNNYIKNIPPSILQLKMNIIMDDKFTEEGLCLYNNPTEPSLLEITKQGKQIKEDELKKTMVFISYSHVDNVYLERLKIHLKPFEKKGLIDIWSDTKIKAGEKWKEKIEKALENSVAAILLISADFLASDFIVDNELPPLLKSAEEKGKLILPVVIKPCRFTKDENLSKFQAVNNPTIPLSKMDENGKEEIYVKITEIVESLAK